MKNNKTGSEKKISTKELSAMIRKIAREKNLSIIDPALLKR